MSILSMNMAGHLSWLGNPFIPSGAISYRSSKLNSLLLLSSTSTSPDGTITLPGCLKDKNKEIAGARISLLPTPCLVHLSQGRPEGQECDPPHISQGSNEPHIVLR